MFYKAFSSIFARQRPVTNTTADSSVVSGTPPPRNTVESGLESRSSSTEANLRRSRWLIGAGWLTIANVASLGATLIVGVILARQLGPKGLGIYSAVTAATLFLSLFVTFRLDLHLVTQLRNDATDHDVYMSVLRVSLLLALPIIGIGELLCVFVFEGPFAVPLAVGLAEVAVAPFLFRRQVLQVRAQPSRIAFAQCLGRSAWVLGVVVIAFVRPVNFLTWVIVARVLAIVIEAVFLSMLAPISKVSPSERSRYTPRLVVIRQSVPLFLAGLTGEGLNRFDQLLLVGLKGTFATGTYAAGARLAEPTGIIAPIAQNVSLPGLVELRRRRDQHRFDEGLIDSLLFMLIPGGLAIAILVVFATPIVTRLYGTAFRGSVSVVIVLAIAEWLTLPGTVYTSLGLAVNRRSALFSSSLVGFILNVILNLLLIPPYGALGAAWASLISYGAATIVRGVWGADVRRSGRATLPIVIRAGAALGVSIALGFVPGVPWAGRAAMVVSAYVVTAWFVHPPTSRRVWQAIRRKRRSVRPDSLTAPIGSEAP